MVNRYELNNIDDIEAFCRLMKRDRVFTLKQLE